MFYLGIDQHARQLTVNLRDENGDTVLRRQVSTLPDKVAAFFADLVDRTAADGGYVAVVEVCGFNDWLLDLLPKAGCRRVILVQPDQRKRHKTDRRDAAQLSELLWINRQRLLAGERIRGLRQVMIATEEERQDRRLTARRRDLGQDLTRVLNAVQHVVRRHNQQHDCPTKGIQTKAARLWLKALALPELDRFELDHLLAQWELLERQIAEVEARIAARAAVHSLVPIVRTLPGAGAYSALAIACRIGDVKRFPRDKSLANYFGLTPGCRNSGEANQRLGSITKQGSAMVRFLLGQLTLHALRKDEGLRNWFRRVKGRRGAKIARVAVMRRLACVLWHMLRKQEPYEYLDARRRRQAKERLVRQGAMP